MADEQTANGPPSRSAVQRGLIALGLMRSSPSDHNPPVLSKIFLILGSITVYNVFASYQAIIDLSSSIHWLARWWRYIISIPFEWIGIDLTLRQREAIVLLAFFTTAATYSLYREVGARVLRIWMIAFKGRIEWKDQDYIRAVLSRNDHLNLWTIVTMIASLGACTLLLFVATGPPQLPLPRWLLYVFPFVFFILAMVGAFTHNPRAPLWFKICARAAVIIIFPFAVIMNWLLIIMSFSKEIVRSLSLLLLILFLDVIAVYTIDPIFAAYPRLPEPPAIFTTG